MAIFSLEEVPPRTRMPAHPKNRDKDPEAYDRYIEYLKNEQIRDSINREKEKVEDKFEKGQEYEFLIIREEDEDGKAVLPDNETSDTEAN